MECNKFAQYLNSLQCQFLCGYPVNSINWQDILNDLSWEQQTEIIANTYKHPLNQEYPIKISYQLNFLKRIIQQLEESGIEIHDVIYESFCKLQTLVPHDATIKYAYKHYLLPKYNTHFTLRESKSFVAEGTTGLCSWQASLALADFILHNAEIVYKKNVLELGAGTGLCSFIIARCCYAKNILLTDGSAECVELMQENIKRNFKNAHKISQGQFQLEKSTLFAQQLKWNEIETFNLTKKIKPELLLAADVVYDDTVFLDLAHTIDFIFNLMENNMEMLLGATVRNEYTLNKFIDLLESLGFSLFEKDTIPMEQSNLYWDRTTPVKILLIRR